MYTRSLGDNLIRAQNICSKQRQRNPMGQPNMDSPETLTALGPQHTGRQKKWYEVHAAYMNKINNYM